MGINMNLPFTVEQFLDVFARYNNAIWPAQLLLNLLALAVVFLAMHRYRFGDLAVSLILGLDWLDGSCLSPDILFRDKSSGLCIRAFMYPSRNSFYLGRHSETPGLPGYIGLETVDLKSLCSLCTFTLPGPRANRWSFIPESSYVRRTLSYDNIHIRHTSVGNQDAEVYSYHSGIVVNYWVHGSFEIGYLRRHRPFGCRCGWDNYFIDFKSK
jgi:hypothetical protein